MNSINSSTYPAYSNSPANVPASQTGRVSQPPGPSSTTVVKQPQKGDSRHFLPTLKTRPSFLNLFKGPRESSATPTSSPVSKQHDGGSTRHMSMSFHADVKLSEKMHAERKIFLEARRQAVSDAINYELNEWGLATDKETITRKIDKEMAHDSKGMTRDDAVMHWSLKIMQTAVRLDVLEYKVSYPDMSENGANRIVQMRFDKRYQDNPEKAIAQEILQECEHAISEEKRAAVIKLIKEDSYLSPEKADKNQKKAEKEVDAWMRKQYQGKSLQETARIVSYRAFINEARLRKIETLKENGKEPDAAEQEVDKEMEVGLKDRTQLQFATRWADDELNAFYEIAVEPTINTLHHEKNTQSEVGRNSANAVQTLARTKFNNSFVKLKREGKSKIEIARLLMKPPPEEPNNPFAELTPDQIQSEKNMDEASRINLEMRNLETSAERLRKELRERQKHTDDDIASMALDALDAELIEKLRAEKKSKEEIIMKGLMVLARELEAN